MLPGATIGKGSSPLIFLFEETGAFSEHDHYSMKAVRTDKELKCPGIDQGLSEHGVNVVTLPQIRT